MESENEAVEQITWADAVSSVLQQMAVLGPQLETARAETIESLQRVPDLKMREMMQRQSMLWEVNGVVLAALHLLLMAGVGNQAMISDIHAAMGCNIRRDN